MSVPVRRPMDPDAYTEDGFARLSDRGEVDVSALATQFETWAILELERLASLVTEAQADDARVPAALVEAGRVAHDTKGQAGVFGYTLAVDVAAAMLRFVRARSAAPMPGDLTAIELHRKALAAILKGRIKGDGGEKGARILDGLRRAVGR